MRFYIRNICCLMLLCSSAYGQKEVAKPDVSRVVYYNDDLVFMSNDSLYIYTGGCKNVWMFVEQFEVDNGIATAPTCPEKAVPFIKIHGNVLYDFSYRSFMDTPFLQKDVRQQLVQTTLNFLVKDKYPFSVVINNRSSNSMVFRNFTNINIQFSQYQLVEKMKSDLLKKIPSVETEMKYLKEQKELVMKRQELTKIKEWMQNPSRIQEFVEEREKKLARAAVEKSAYQSALDSLLDIVDTAKKTESLKAIEGKRDSLQFNTGGMNLSLKKQSEMLLVKIDSVYDIVQDRVDSIKKNAETKLLAVYDDSSYTARYNEKKKKYEKLESDIKKLELDVMRIRKKLVDSLTKIKSQINNIRDANGLYSFATANGIAKDSFSRMQKILLSVKQLGIGSSLLDYSELTVKNITLSGLNMELNPGRFYFAFAAGKVGYRFRDFVAGNNSNQPKQDLYLIRAGLGKKEASNVIVTYYAGHKSNLISAQNVSPYGSSPVMGIAVEAKLAIDENNFFVAEIAKSSYLSNPASVSTSSDLLSKMFNLGKRTNEAYFIKFYGKINSSDSRITASFKKMGENFQSFNLNPVNVNQSAWMIKLTQGVWNKKLNIEAAVRKNDFASPIAAPSFSSKTVFKSLTATFRAPKYPMITIGYYPTSQLALNENSVLQESQYNTLNAIVSHSYWVNQISMNTNATLTRFYNSNSDTGFLYYNAVGFSFNHTIYLHDFSFQSNFSLSEQKALNLLSLEQQLTCRINRSISLTGGIKWSRANHAETLLGGSTMININFNKIGSIQCSYQKTYLPGSSQRFVPVDFGRLSLYREF